MKNNIKEKDNFFNLVDSLKKCRRADLSDINNDDNIIEKLYVDPLEGDFVLKSILKPNTTMLIGRKGTGKSTVIARLQHEIRKSNDKLSLYIDVKSIFEQSSNYNYDTNQYKNLFKSEDLEKYLIYKTFLKEIVKEIKRELKTNTVKFFLAKITKVFGPDKKAYEEELEEIFNEIEKNEYEDIELIKEKRKKNVDKDSSLIETSDDFKIGASVNLNAIKANCSYGYKDAENYSASRNIEEKYSEVLLRCFNPRLILTSIKTLLSKIGIKYVFICLDDFSEIEIAAMKVFVDIVVSPLNNWSDEYFKFKIAAYPGRIYLGDIDPQKIEQIKLDYYDLFKAKRITDIHLEAQKSIKKLLEVRIDYFCKKDIHEYFDTSKCSPEEYYKVLFNITASVPRNVGWVLWYAYQQSISKDNRITVADLEIASEKHYIDSVLPYFSKNKFMREPFFMKLEKYHLNELLNTIISSSKSNKKEIATSTSKIFQKDKHKPLTSHFYIDKKYEDLLLPLELQFFISKYNEQKDQDSNTLMSFFSLNYGLCMKEDIYYGRGSDRKYIIQRRFNYTSIINNYVAGAKQIKCQNSDCQKVHSFDLLDNLRLFDMLCPKCKKGKCKIEHVVVDLPMIDDKLQIPEFDINLLSSLNIDQPQYPSSLAQELDCTYQKVTKRAIKLSEKGYIKKEKKMFDPKIGTRSYYYLTDNAINTYFNS